MERQLDDRSLQVLGAAQRKRLQGKVPAHLLAMSSDFELGRKYVAHMEVKHQLMVDSARKSNPAVITISAR